MSLERAARVQQTHWLALFLFLLTLLVRFPFQSQTLNHWDSVNHALALTSFNVAAHRPQPPGYILYIGIARLVNLAVPDAQTALVLVSILASGLAVAFLFLLGARMASREIGLVAALLLLTAPPFWFDGEVALPYVVEGCASVALALLLYKMLSGDKGVALFTAAVFAISVGLRQQMALFFAPLVVYVYWKQNWRVRLEALFWFTLVCLLWFVPLVLSAGGVGAYLDALRNLNSAFSSEFVLAGTGGPGALVRNLTHMGAYTLYALNLSILPLLVGGFQIVRTRWGRRASGLWGDERIRFIGLWIAPSVIFYLFFHMGSPGLIYVYLSALFLLAAFGLRQLTRTQPLVRNAVVVGLCAVNLFIFFGTPPDLYTGQAIRILNYSALVEHDRSLTARVDALDSKFNPQTTLIVSDDWRFAEYYLPAFRVLFLSGNAQDPLLVAQHDRESYLRAEKVDVSQVEQIVWFDPGARARYPKPTDCMPIEDDTCLPFVSLARKGGVKILPDHIEVLAP